MRPRISSKPVPESYDPSIRNITSRLFESVRKDAETKETSFEQVVVITVKFPHISITFSI